MKQDYSLLGHTGKDAVASGLSNPHWFRPKVEPKDIRNLSIKQDLRPTIDALIWLGLLITSGSLAVYTFPSWWGFPFWLAYGVLYSSASDARWHECGHSTAFKTPWKNELIYQVASFFLLRSPPVWRASHVRHHTDTIIVGRDPEIQNMRPPDLVKQILGIFGLIELKVNLTRWFSHVRGKINEEEATYVREKDFPKVFFVARVWGLIFLVTLTSAVFFKSIIPILLVVTPRLYGSWQMSMTGALQHLGMAENVTDHRLNTRTVMMGPINRFLYLNMNYHVEHHMFTMIPYYQLPALRELIKDDLPAAEPSIFSAYRRLLPVLWKQLADEKAVIIYDLPEGAIPYRDEVKYLQPHSI
jgi:fatty acid desaturase